VDGQAVAHRYSSARFVRWWAHYCCGRIFFHNTPQKALYQKTFEHELVLPRLCQVLSVLQMPRVSIAQRTKYGGIRYVRLANGVIDWVAQPYCRCEDTKKDGPSLQYAFLKFGFKRLPLAEPLLHGRPCRITLGQNEKMRPQSHHLYRKSKIWYCHSSDVKQITCTTSACMPFFPYRNITLCAPN